MSSGCSKRMRSFKTLSHAGRVTNKLIAAIAFAADKHRNQRRKDHEASPYPLTSFDLTPLISIADRGATIRQKLAGPPHGRAPHPPGARAAPDPACGASDGPRR